MKDIETFCYRRNDKIATILTYVNKLDVCFIMYVCRVANSAESFDFIKKNIFSINVFVLRLITYLYRN